MNILLVSQCSKSALTETRRVIDQFLERRGSRTWQGAITQEGLTTLRTLLKKTARRNTAVACHWTHGKNHTELLWIVGNSRRFNHDGAVPTNTTGRNIVASLGEDQWHTLEDMRLLAGLAALFHDFGKANLLFQQKLLGKRGLQEPYRHEWVSLRLFAALVGDAKDDKHWLQRLADIAEQDELQTEQIKKDGLDDKTNGSPLKNLPPLAQAVGWLILTHHRLPVYPVDGDREPDVKNVSDFLTVALSNRWNSPQCTYDKWTKKERTDVWKFAKGTPIHSAKWRFKMAEVARRALTRFSQRSTDWLNDRFSLHLSRMVLMLADHYYSSQPGTGQWRDKGYKVFANTYRNTGEINQGLDEHLIGVYRNSFQMCRFFPVLREQMPTVTQHRKLRKRTAKTEFKWQNKAFDLCQSIAEQTYRNGFFGVNLASTGKGKTFANLRIIYGLSDPKAGLRVSIALGLRTLTLQTGDAVRAMLTLDDDDIAVLVGSSAVQQLHRLRQQEEDQLATHEQETNAFAGSESAEDILEQDIYISYDGSLEGPLKHWLKDKPKLNRMVSAPILVSTIDHLMPATEGARGGRQIAPMLRLLSSDLVLDEPDDFSLEDLPALCRLVNWAGLLGSKVLLSSATLPPSIVQALFDAYCAGRQSYEQACGDVGKPMDIPCAWFDEFGTAEGRHNKADTFLEQHKGFIKKRIAKLSSERNKRLLAWLPVAPAGKEPTEILCALSDCVLQSIHELHDLHAEPHPESGQKISLGLVRLANINPLVALAEQLMTMPAKPGYRIHYCVYHSQHLLIRRSAIEKMLDRVLNRKEKDSPWANPIIQSAMAAHPNEQHIFVVLGSPVTEVGRDWSLNWAIAEPSSMRALIQLAGRVQRHREEYPASANIRLFNQNINALKAKRIAYCRPGFEAKAFQLAQHDLRDATEAEQLTPLNANTRIQQRDTLNPEHNWIDLEHAHLHACLYGSQGNAKQSAKPPASLWWQTPADWTYELQRHTPFRQSQKQFDYFYYVEDECSEASMWRWHLKQAQCKDEQFNKVALPALAEGIEIWGEFHYRQLLDQISQQLDMPLAQASVTFGAISLRDIEAGQWCFNEVLGVYQRFA